MAFAAVTKTKVANTLFRHIVSRGLQTTSTKLARLRSDGWWITEHRPGLYPKNEEERKASAFKYGLRPEDYVPFPEDFVVRGDYPELGDINYGVKDPYENWSYPREGFNYGEPLRMDHFVYFPDRYTPTGLERPLWEIYLKFLGYHIFLITLICVMMTCGPIHHGQKTAKQYPYAFDYAGFMDDPQKYPLVHYTFEPAGTPDTD